MLQTKRLKSQKPKIACSFRLEQQSQKQLIAGVDEVGRGCLAGPVFAAAVQIDPSLWNADYPEIAEICDSKKTSEPKRQRLSAWIRANCRYAVASLDAATIDRMNILQASLAASKQAVILLQKQLPKPIEWVLVDGLYTIPGLSVQQQAVVAGDSVSKSIAAASIVAKVARDEWMQEQASRYPQYLFEKHKGYGTAEHRAAIQKWGVTDLHRRTFLKGIMQKQAGHAAESKVAETLRSMGFEILFQNFACPGAEIDLIASRDDKIHFFEVRSRTSAASVEREFSVHKQNQFKKAIDLFFLRNRAFVHHERQAHLALVSAQDVQFVWDVFL